MGNKNESSVSILLQNQIKPEKDVKDALIHVAQNNTDQQNQTYYAKQGTKFKYYKS